MTERRIARIDRDGRPVEQVLVPAGEEPRRHYTARGRGLRTVEVDRWAQPGERWRSGRWQLLDGPAAEAAIDAAHVADHGVGQLALAHATKALEARLLLAGGTIDGWVAAEARATGVGTLDLARAIVAHDDAAKDIEVARRAAKHAIRSRS